MTKDISNRLTLLLVALLLVLPAPVGAQTEWVTFRDTQFKFRFNYPPDWQIGTPRGPDVRGKVLSPQGRPIANCVVVVRSLPESAQYTQKALNRDLDSEIWGADDWLDALSANVQGAMISETKRIKIDGRPAQFAVSVIPYGISEARIFMKSVNFITMSPGYIWRFGCGAAGQTESDAATAYEAWKPVFLRIFSSFVFEN